MKIPSPVIPLFLANVFLSSVACAGTIDRVPGRDALYMPDSVEQQVIDIVVDKLGERGITADYDPMISLAIYHTLIEAKSKTSYDCSTILRMAGGTSAIFASSCAQPAIPNAETLDSALIKLTSRTRFGLVTITNHDSLWLCLYATDMGITSSVPCTYLDGGGSFYPDIPAPYEISICGSIAADTIIYILYKGESTLDIPTDSIIESGGTTAKDGIFRVVVRGRKGELETLTLNVYGQRRTPEVKELIMVAYAPTLITSKKRGDL